MDEVGGEIWEDVIFSLMSTDLLFHSRFVCRVDTQAALPAVCQSCTYSRQLTLACECLADQVKAWQGVDFVGRIDTGSRWPQVN